MELKSKDSRELGNHLFIYFDSISIKTIYFDFIGSKSLRKNVVEIKVNEVKIKILNLIQTKNIIKNLNLIQTKNIFNAFIYIIYIYITY